jgi:glyoxylase-like metal-dependent hydrolase (beta-lactamase superfamily II)
VPTNSKHTGAKIAVHENDTEFVAGTKPSPKPKNLLFRAFSSFIRYEPVQPDIVLKENDKTGGLQVIHAPGHTPGSISLYEQERKDMFVGDSIRCSHNKITGPPVQFTLDMKEAIQPIKEISNFDFDLMLSGHGKPLRPEASTKVRDFCASLQQNEAKESLDIPQCGGPSPMSAGFSLRLKR